MLSTLMQIQDSAVDGSVVTALVVVCSIVGIVFSILNYLQTAKIKIYPAPDSSAEDSSEQILLSEEDGRSANNRTPYQKVSHIASAISEGANAFLRREYTVMGLFMILFSIVIIVFIGSFHNWPAAVFTAIAFNVGAATSIVSGFIGMRIAVFSNSRTALQARAGFSGAFVTAFRAATVMGFCLVSIGTIVLYILLNFFTLYWKNAVKTDDDGETAEMYEAIAGYGLGGSAIALFGRVGGGIYTKAADVGADLSGKLEFDIPEDDPRNPAVIADNVGDNVGDIAGMGADLFGSFAESTCAAMVISAARMALKNMLKWVSSAPFGCPVVPDV